MYTGEQLRASIGVAEDLRRRREAVSPVALHDPIDALICDGCGEVVSDESSSRAGWLNVVEPDSSVAATRWAAITARGASSHARSAAAVTCRAVQCVRGAGLVAKRY